MNGNIIGEEFEEYVFGQIAQRQKNQYSGYTDFRTPEQLQYLNNTNAWIKLASGVSIDEGTGGLERLRKIIEDDTLVNQFNGEGLAKKTVLFNGLSETDPAVYNDGKKVEKKAENNLRSGYSKTSNIWNLTSVYGLGGSDFGQQPMPGIQSINIKSLNRGSIREANIKLKAYNKFQFAILELLYLRIGFTMMLEWGNDKFINNEGEFQDMGNTIIEDLWFSSNSYTQLTMINAIERYRGIYHGNYDGFFGKVVNFTWTFGADGSYDIDLKLITVGDVIESLQANIPVDPSEVGLIETTLSSSMDNNTEYVNLADSSIVNAAQNNKIGKYLFTSISNKELWGNSNPEYFSLKKQNNTTSNSRGKNSSNFQLDQKINDKYNYFMTFGELLNIFQNNIIPGIKLGDNIDPCLDIETDPLANKISYYPNQTSLDPRVCIFKYIFGDTGNNSPTNDISGIIPPSYLKTLEEYVGVIGKDVLYGKIMNIYLNYDFISTCLMSNTKDGKLSVFKFFQKICDGINSALGGVNNIEPVIKDDKIITFIDQNPIPGYLETLSKDKTIVDLEVYGYNESKGVASFVQDISFKTEITPKLSSMMTIGTTAGGANEDGTAFSKWNDGLKDRFALQYIDANNNKITVEKKSKQNRIKELVSIYHSKATWTLAGDDDTENGIIEGINTYGGKRGNDRISIIYEGINGIMSAREFVIKQLAHDEYMLKNEGVLTQSQLASSKSSNYVLYLAEAFGGRAAIKILTVILNRKRKKITTEKYIDPVSPSKSKYTLFDSKFIDRAKSTYKVYINALMKSEFHDNEDTNERTASNQIGFIPVGFGITLQGISGIKIYNKLNINNNFLPYQYPEALKFVVKGVNHKVDNNTWNTSLDTISIPKVKPSKDQDISKFIKTSEIYLPENERGPIETDKPPVFALIQYQGKEITINEVLSKMNPEARPSFRKFLMDFQLHYFGYTMKINAIGRTFERSVELQKENPDNASPGYSKHNYYAGLDFNIITSQGQTLMKQGMRTKWINQGFQKLAKKYNIEWGGDFSGYEDCIHFSHIFNINTAVNNAIAKFGSLENLKGDQGKQVKLT